ncbi:hypothetical protein GCM10027299_07840 [Larkinella ripae]
MAYRKEPKGVDFIIESEPLTDQARQEISDFIRNYKMERQTRATASKSGLRRQKKPSHG